MSYRRLFQTHRPTSCCGSKPNEWATDLADFIGLSTSGQNSNAERDALWLR
jgi:hypothetical protein